MLRFHSVLIGSIVPVLASVCAAQEDSAAPPVLEPYSVTATQLSQPASRVPFSVSQLNADQIQTASLQLSLDEPLQTIPGVFVLNPYNYAQDSRISIRGFGARANFGIRGVQLFADGIPATTPDGQGSVDAIDLGSTERIQVLRGPASAIYGASAGGVILLETETGPSVPFLETRLTGGSDDLFQAQIKSGGRRERLDYLMSGNYLEYDGYRDHSETENRRFNAKFGYALSEDSSLTGIVNVIDIPEQNDPGGLTLQEAKDDPSQARQRNVDFGSGESVEQTTVGIRYDQRLDASRSFELKSYYSYRDFENRLPFESGGQVAFERDFFGVGGLYRVRHDRFEAVAGFSFDSQMDDRVRYDNLNGERGDLSLKQDEDIESLGFFLVSSYTPIENLTFSGALRQDSIEYEVDDAFLDDGDDSGERDFDETSPMFGVIWEFAPEAAIYANIAQSFETPTSTELANPGGGGGGGGGGFNPDLDPQTATSYEIGLRGTYRLPDDRGFRYELVAFHIDIEDSLVPFELITDPGRDYFRNAGESERDGIEAAFGFDLLSNLTVYLSYTWSDFEYTDYEADGEDFSGNQLPGVPEHFANLQVNYRHDCGFFARWNTRYTGEMEADDGNTTTVDDSTVSDLRIGFRGEKGNWTYEPFVGLNNVFDESYFANIRINAFGGRYYEPAPERNLYAGIRVRYDFE